MPCVTGWSAYGVTRVAMEATGVYWKPVFYVLEDAMECWLLNARHMRNVPGRKTDVGDAEWICQLTEHGLVRPSFVAPKEIRDLREFTRYRRTLVEERTREAQRLDKVLQDAGVKLSSVASDVLGASGRAMLAALVEGSRDPDALAELAKGKLRAKLPALRSALEGRFSARHALLVSEILSHLDYLDEAIERMTSAIEEAIAPFADARDRLCYRPGRRPARCRGDHRRDRRRHGAFPERGPPRLLGRDVPGPARVGRQAKTRAPPATATAGCSVTSPSPPWPRSAPRTPTCAPSTAGSAARRGKLRARKAVGHSVLVACWHILASPGATYIELGPDWFDRRNSPALRARRKLSELRSLGCEVRHNDDGTATIVLPAA